MLDIISKITNWTGIRKRFALATVIETWGSAPRPVGSAMAVTEDLEMIGSVSGGCVEGSVLREATKVIESGKPRRLMYGVSNEDAWAVGLSCGGKIKVFLEPFMAFDPDPAERSVWESLNQAVAQNHGCVLLTRLWEEGNEHILVFPDGQTVGQQAAPLLIEQAQKAFRERQNLLLEHGDAVYFAEVFPRKSQLLLIGAAHIAADLVDLANQFGFETIVIDPRGIFVQKTHFPNPPHQLIEKWPEEVMDQFTLDAYTYAVLLSHDPKIDDQALHRLLGSEIAYIGALGSSRTQERRRRRLLEAGFTGEEIARIHGPIGVPINARTPKEIALAIMAEIIRVKNAYAGK